MKLIVIGNGMVGQRLLEKLQAGASSLETTVLCEESRPAYDRVHLTSYFSGRVPESCPWSNQTFSIDRESPSSYRNGRSGSIASGVW